MSNLPKKHLRTSHFAHVRRVTLSGKWPIILVSMDERISAPVTSSVIPNVCNSSRWPSAVPPPWLPMAGIRNGIALNFFEVIYYSLDDDGIICDGAAPTRNGDGVAGFNLALQA
jgi:hypothetical protein